MEKTFTVIDDDGAERKLRVQVTDEGIIADLWDADTCIATFGATAQELADEFCH